MTQMPIPQDGNDLKKKIDVKLFDEDEIYFTILTQSDMYTAIGCILGAIILGNVFQGLLTALGLLSATIAGLLPVFFAIGGIGIGIVVVLTKRAIRHSKERGYVNALINEVKFKMSGKLRKYVK